MTSDNNLLGKFDLTGIPPAPKGVPEVRIILYTHIVNNIIPQSFYVICKENKKKIGAFAKFLTNFK